MAKYKVTIINKENVRVEKTFEKIKEATKQVANLLDWGHKVVTIEKFNTNE